MLSCIFNFIKYLDEKRRPCLANILYSLCAITAIISFVYQISPFDVQIPFHSSVSIKYILTDRSVLPHATLIMYALYFLGYILSRIIYQVFLNAAPSKAIHVYIKFRSVMYILELTLSILSTALILASILQFYHTGIFYGSIRAWGVYLFVGLKFILFLFDRQQIQWDILEQKSLHTQDKHCHPNRS